MNPFKETIINALIAGEEADLLAVIPEYYEKYPYDIDVYIIEGYLLNQVGESEKAEHIVRDVVQRAPFDIDAHFVLGNILLVQGNLLESIEHFMKAELLAIYYKDQYLLFSIDSCDEKVRMILDELEEQLKNETVEIQNHVKYINYQNRSLYSLTGDFIRTKDNIIGEYFYTAVNELRYCGYYNTIDYNYFEEFSKKNMWLCMGEVLKVYSEKQGVAIDIAQPVLLPIASKETQNQIRFCFADGTSVEVVPDGPKHFNYYRVEQSVRVVSSKPIIIGEPVKLAVKPENKKLVINLFVDGFSQQLITEEGFENVMPNTYRFFSKGMIAKNCFTNSDWTYPSLAGAITGHTVLNHMLIHPKLNTQIPKSKTMFEHFADAGYYTAMISGDWRSSMTYGYLRGIDRYVAKHQCFGFRTEHVINYAIEHMETFKETNQYLWIETADLHDIADEFDLVTSVQAQTPIKDYQAQERSATSVKQKYSPQKRSAYIKAAHQIDIYLENLYHYLSEHYQEDEYIINIFGDHGQTYFTQPEQHHLSRTHTNVAFMTRGGGFSGTNEEYFNLNCMPNIMCRLADMKCDLSDTDGILPKCYGGDTENEMAFSETFHPGDPYMVSIHTKEYTFFMTTENCVTKYGRLEPGNYTVKLLDHAGEEKDDPDIINRCIEYVKEHTKYIMSY